MDFFGGWVEIGFYVSGLLTSTLVTSLVAYPLRDRRGLLRQSGAFFYPPLPRPMFELLTLLIAMPSLGSECFSFMLILFFFGNERTS